jgi:hypothetical protein
VVPCRLPVSEALAAGVIVAATDVLIDADGADFVFGEAEGLALALVAEARDPGAALGIRFARLPLGQAEAQAQAVLDHTPAGAGTTLPVRRAFSSYRHAPILGRLGFGLPLPLASPALLRRQLLGGKPGKPCSGQAPQHRASVR